MTVHPGDSGGLVLWIRRQGLGLKDGRGSLLERIQRKQGVHKHVNDRFLNDRFVVLERCGELLSFF
jgi:hypothetical protein